MRTKLKVYEDLEEARRLWQRHWPQRCLFDLWPVRACFQSQFDFSPFFLVATDGGEFRGMLALSRIDEEDYFGHFPGEIWQGNTWIEQNKILANDPEVLKILLEHIPAAVRIRYLTEDSYPLGEACAGIDETGYLFFPKEYGYSYQDYLQCFSGKSRKKIRSELKPLLAAGVSYRYDRLADADHLFRLNLERYKETSYFKDSRFLRSFERLVSWLHANKMLRLTTVLIDGRIGAVDVGAVWNSTYTVLAGGTHPDFPGIAKLINFHHIEWACHERFSEVDFLCGDFNWKKRFHLTPRPLYKICSPPALEEGQEVVANGRVVCAG
jgi:hypothetical protein